MHDVATLALGLWSKQGLAKVQAKNEAQESHFMFLGMWGSVKEWTSTLPNEAPTLGVGVSIDSQIFKGQLQGSKPIGLKISLYHWKVLRT
jgi:hypothetical protein